MSDQQKRDRGMAFFRPLVAGQDKPISLTKGAMPERFVDYTLEHLFGDVWQGDELSLQ